MKVNLPPGLHAGRLTVRSDALDLDAAEVLVELLDGDLYVVSEEDGFTCIPSSHLRRFAFAPFTKKKKTENTSSSDHVSSPARLPDPPDGQPSRPKRLRPRRA